MKTLKTVLQSLKLHTKAVKLWAVLFLSAGLSAEGIIQGTVIDSDTGKPVFGATVAVRSHKKFTKTDFDGKYSLEVPDGSSLVEFQMFGYDGQKKSVNVKPGSTVSLNVTFGIKTLETVEVTGRAANNTDASLLALQRKSGSVSDGISQESIRKSPDSSAGEVAKRVTGITLIGGKYVFVRGLGERYSNTMLNNSLLPSTEPDKRVVPLDIFPANLIKNIRIIKTFLPEDSAEFSGGLVKVETQEYPDKFTMNLSFGVSRNWQTTGNPFLTFKGGDMLGRVTPDQKLPSLIAGLPEQVVFEPGNRFGGIPSQFVSLSTSEFAQGWTPKKMDAPYDKNFSFSIGNTFKITEGGARLGILFGTSHSNTFRFKEDKSRRYIPGNLVATGVQSTNYITKVQEQDTKVYNEDTLWGNNLNIALEPTKGHSIYWKNMYSVNSDKQVRDASGINYIDNFQFLSLTNIFTSRSLLNSVFGGTHALNFTDRPHKLEWNINYSQAVRDEPNLQQQVWRRSDPPGTVIGSNGVRYLENYTRLGNNPDGTRFFSRSEDNVRAWNLSYEIPFNQWAGLKSTLKVGAMQSEREKNFRFREFGQKVNTGGGNEIYPLPGELLYNPLVFLSGGRTFSERQVEPNAYDASQKLKAVFAQVDMPIIQKWRFVGGFRQEESYQKVQTFVLRDSANPFKKPDTGCSPKNETERLLLINSNVCKADNNGIGELATKDRLPSANFIYEIKEDMNLRFGYSETLTRPDLRELSPFGFTPYFGADRIFGNSDLRRTYIHNYDVRWEWFQKGTDYMAVGVFNKQLSNPIEMIGQPVAGSISARFTYGNATSAYIRGLEFDYRKEFLNMFRAETNFFFIKSRVDVLPWTTYAFAKAGFLDRNSRAFAYDPTNLSRSLQGQSEFVFNLKLDYFITKTKNTTVGLYYNYFGDRIYAVGANGTPDAIEKGVGLTDAVFQHKADDKWDFKFAVRNIMNTRFRIYQHNHLTGRDELFLSYREGLNIALSATMRL